MGETYPSKHSPKPRAGSDGVRSKRKPVSPGKPSRRQVLRVIGRVDRAGPSRPRTHDSDKEWYVSGLDIL